MASISIRHVHKVYPGGVTAVKDCNLEIADKEFVILAGPSGCGKTTMLRMIAGLEDISSGEIHIGGRLVNDVPPKERNIAMVFQNDALYPHMTVYKNMAFALAMKKAPKNEIDHLVRETAKALEIEHLLGRKPKELSGGQRQRVALGKAMVRDPAVFLLDEPLSSLDAKLRTSMRMELIKLHKQLEATFVYVTHDQTEAMTMGERIVVMNDAVVQQVDTPQNVYDSPCNMFVAGFVGSPQMNFLDAVLREDGKGFFLETRGHGQGHALYLPAEKTAGSLRRYVGQAVKMGIRPEHLHDDAAFLATNAGAEIAASVEVCERMGSEAFLHLQYGDAALVVRTAPTTASKRGDEIRVGFDMRKAHLFDAETEEAIQAP